MADLDDRIRDIVARAAADAPPAPDLDEATRIRRGDGSPRSRSRWVAGGIAGLSAAAALVALIWIGGDRVDDEAVVPATVPPTRITTVPVIPAPATSPPGGTTDVPVTVPPTIGGSVVPDPPASSALTGSAPAVEPTIAPSTLPSSASGESRIVRAGPGGVTTVRFDGSGGELVTDEAMAIAQQVPDGRVFMQRSSDARDPDADTTLLVSTTPHVIAPLAVPDELDGEPLRLHDAAVVGGDVVILIESGPGRCVGFPDCDGSLWALYPDAGRAELILTQSMWEAGFGRLHLADTGVIVGESFSEAVSMPFSSVVPGSETTGVDMRALGLDDLYVDCSTCPSAFAVDRAGSTIAWLERETDADGVITQDVIVLATVDGATISRLPLIDERTGPGAGRLLAAAWLELVDVSAEPGTSAGRLFVNPQPFDGLEPTPPVSVDLDAGTITDTGLPPGTVATAS